MANALTQSTQRGFRNSAARVVRPSTPIAFALRTYRAFTGQSLTDVGEEVGVSGVTIGEIETETISRPQARTLRLVTEWLYRENPALLGAAPPLPAAVGHWSENVNVPTR